MHLYSGAPPPLTSGKTVSVIRARVFCRYVQRVSFFSFATPIPAHQRNEIPTTPPILSMSTSTDRSTCPPHISSNKSYLRDATTMPKSKPNHNTKQILNICNCRQACNILQLIIPTLNFQYAKISLRKYKLINNIYHNVTNIGNIDQMNFQKNYPKFKYPIIRFCKLKFRHLPHILTRNYYTRTLVLKLVKLITKIRC